MFRRNILYVLILMVLSGFSAYGQRKVVKQLPTPDISKWDWVAVAKDRDDITYYVDADVSRQGELVMYMVLAPMNGINVAHLVTGNCISGVMTEAPMYILDQNDKTTRVTDPQRYLRNMPPHEKGTIGYEMLTYACTYAK